MIRPLSILLLLISVSALHAQESSRYQPSQPSQPSHSPAIDSYGPRLSPTPLTSPRIEQQRQSQPLSTGSYVPHMGSPRREVPPPPMSANEAAAFLVPKERKYSDVPPDVQLQVERFFLTIQQKQVDKAFDDLLKDNDRLKRKYNVSEFVSKTKQALELYGDMSGYELFDSRLVSSRIVVLTYFIYLDAIPLRWKLVYYTPGRSDQWRLINLRVDDLLDESLLME